MRKAGIRLHGKKAMKRMTRKIAIRNGPTPPKTLMPHPIRTARKMRKSIK
jgi:hypothetical protein